MNTNLQTKVTYVLKRNGNQEAINIHKITKRLQHLAEGLDMQYVNINNVVKKVVQGMYEGVKTTVLDNLAAETCAYMNIIHPDYSKLAAKIAVDNLHKQTNPNFLETAKKLYNCTDTYGRRAPLLNQRVFQIITKNHQKIQNQIDYSRDFTYDFFGFKTLQRSYLLKVNGKVVQRPQHLLMRVSLGIHNQDLQKAFQTYHYLSLKYFTHATPTLFNAGTPFAQMSSCFLIHMKDDSITGIYQTLTECAKISKMAGGIGISISNIRASGSYIRGTNGNSNGIVPMLRVFNDTARYVDQGGGKRKGSFAIYLQPWHADIFQFLQLKKNTGKEQNRARDLFYALWIPDLFMKRVINDQQWTLMCPNECPGLVQLCAQKFNQAYQRFEREGKGRITIKARVLWQAVVDAQIQTGTPYMVYKDSANLKSNQQHLGTIKSSNLCTQIIQYSSKQQTAVCNLASISLPKFVQNGKFNYQLMNKIVRIITRNMNKIIDLNLYPTQCTKISNLRHRPIGIGVQGLADTFQKINIQFESQQALDLNQRIFQSIYYAASCQSMELAKVQGPYQTFPGSPSSKGLLQFDLWNYTPHLCNYDWKKLKEDIMKFGTRNSLLIAPMPTASTSQILGNNESIEPYTSNVYTRRVLAGEFVCVNQNLVNTLSQLNLWNQKIKNKVLKDDGSVSNIQQIPEQIRRVYKTVWEISQKAIINLAVNRAPFIDQSQSLNIHMADPNYSKICSMHFYAWEKGLKTGSYFLSGMYYLRSRPAADPIKFTLDHQQFVVQKKSEKQNLQTGNLRKMIKLQKVQKVCKLKGQRGEQCFSCGS